jgi:hypothetical protein
MDDWMIRWAFTASFVTVGAFPCGWILALALISYSLACFASPMRSPWGAGGVICLGMLVLWARTSLAVVAQEPLPADPFLIAREFSAAGLVITALLPLLGLLRGKDFPPLRRWSVLAWDALFGISYILGFMSCSPYFATLAAGAGVAGASGIAPLGAYALGLLILTFTLMGIAALLRRLLPGRSEGDVRHVRAVALMTLAAAGLLRFWL